MTTLTLDTTILTEVPADSEAGDPGHLEAEFPTELGTILLMNWSTSGRFEVSLEFNDNAMDPVQVVRIARLLAQVGAFADKLNGEGALTVPIDAGDGAQ